MAFLLTLFSAYSYSSHSFGIFSLLQPFVLGRELTPLYSQTLSKFNFQQFFIFYYPQHPCFVHFYATKKVNKICIIWKVIFTYWKSLSIISLVVKKIRCFPFKYGKRKGIWILLQTIEPEDKAVRYSYSSIQHTSVILKSHCGGMQHFTPIKFILCVLDFWSWLNFCCSFAQVGSVPCSVGSMGIFSFIQQTSSLHHRQCQAVRQALRAMT